MKTMLDYTLTLEIEAPRAVVLDRFLDREAVPKWQYSLVRSEMITEGDPNVVGAKSLQLNRMGKREVEMVETITAREDPSFYAATYEADGVWNLIENRFEEGADGRTHWNLRSEFRCRGLFMKAMCWLFPGQFRKQTLEFMEAFKRYVEGQA